MLDYTILPTEWKLVPCKGKIPWDYQKECTTNFKTIDFDASLNPISIGLHTGPSSGGIVCLDFDGVGTDLLFELKTGYKISNLPDSVSWTSGKEDRQQIAFKVPEKYWDIMSHTAIGDKAITDNKFEIRWDNLSVFSGFHPETDGYYWINSPETTDVADAPEWLLHFFKSQHQSSVPYHITSTVLTEDEARILLSVLPAHEFTSHDSWFKSACALKQVSNALLEDWVQWCSGMYNFDEKECRKTWRAIKKKGHIDPKWLLKVAHQHGYQLALKEAEHSRLVKLIGFKGFGTTSDESPTATQILGSDFKARIFNQGKERELDGTIPEDIFINEMIRLWEGYGNHYSDKFIECWKGILHCFNLSLQRTGINISSATMGAGKTSTALLCLAIYSVLYPHNGALMVCRRIEECDELEASLNDLLDYGNALAVHSETDETDKWQSNVESTRIVLTTHVGYLAASSLGSKDLISSYRGNRRSLTIIDESLGFINRYTITKKFINDVNRKLLAYSNSFFFPTQFPNEMAKLQAIHDRIGKQQSSSDGELFRGVFADIEDRFPCSLQKVAKAIAKTRAEDWDEKDCKRYYENKDDYSFFDFKQALIHDLISIQNIISLALWVTQDTTETHLSSGELMQRVSDMLLQNDELQSCVILDGTSHIDNTYELLQERFGQELIHIQCPVKGVRDWSKVSILVRSESSGTGKNTSVTRAGSRSEKIMDWARSEFSSEDKVIFCGTKKLMAALKKVTTNNPLPFKHDFIHWGCIDGRNDLKDFNKTVFLSVPNGPRNYHEQSVLALGLEDKYLASKGWNNYRYTAESSYVAIRIAQAAARDAKRRVISDAGDCIPCTTYLILSGSKMNGDKSFDDVHEKLSPLSQGVIRYLQDTFEGANWGVWQSFEGFNESQRGRKLTPDNQAFLNWLDKKMASGQRIKLNDIFASLVFDEDQCRKVRKSIKSDAVSKMISSYGVTIEVKKGRNGYITFSKK